MRKFFGVLMIVALALSVSGIAFAQDDTIVLRVWTGSSSNAENEAKEAQVAAFEAANPNIDVELLISPDYGTQIQAAFASGNYPDVFTVGQGEFPSLQQSAVLAQGGDSIEAADDIYPSLLAAFTANETAYCVPKDFSTLALFYNTDVFDAAGVEYPTSEWTWDDMTAAAAAIAENVEGVTGVSVAADRDRWLGFLFGNGASIFDEEGNVVINSPEAVAALEFYTNFAINGTGAVPSDLESSGWNGEAFGRGLAGMTIEGNWAIGFLQSDYPELNWAVAELPLSPNGTRGTLTFTECWAVGANSANPEAAWALVNALTGVEGAATVATAGFGVMPARPSSAEAWLETRGEEYAPFVAGAEYAVAPVFPVGFSDMTTLLNENTIAVMAGNMSAQEALDDVAEVGNEIVAELGE